MEVQTLKHGRQEKQQHSGIVGNDRHMQVREVVVLLLCHQFESNLSSLPRCLLLECFKARCHINLDKYLVLCLF